MIFIITGARNEGKTKLLRTICTILNNKTKNVKNNIKAKADTDGFICVKHFLPGLSQIAMEDNRNDQGKDKNHIGYDLIRVSGRTIIPFIRLLDHADPYYGKGFFHGSYIFFNKGIASGKKILQECHVNKTKNIIIDEVGKLELEGKIFSGEIRKLLKNSDIKYTEKINLFMTVRTEFFELVLEHFGIEKYTLIQTRFSERKIKKILRNII